MLAQILRSWQGTRQRKALSRYARFLSHTFPALCISSGVGTIEREGNSINEQVVEIELDESHDPECNPHASLQATTRIIFTIVWEETEMTRTCASEYVTGFRGLWDVGIWSRMHQVDTWHVFLGYIAILVATFVRSYALQFANWRGRFHCTRFLTSYEIKTAVWVTDLDPWRTFM